MPPDYYEEEEFEAEYSGKTMLRIIKMMRPHVKYVAGFLFATLAVSGLDSLFTYISKLIIDKGIVANDHAALIKYLSYFGGMTILQAMMVFGFIYLVSLLGERIRYDLRQRMFNHLQNLSLAYYSRTPVGWIMARVTSDSDRVADLMTWGLMDSTWSVMSVLSSLGFMLYINWKMALIVLALLPVMFYIALQFRKRILGEFRNVRKTNSKITGAYNENITGVRVVKALGRQEENLREFGLLTGEMYRAAFRAAWLSALFLPSVQMITALALGGIVWYGGLQAQYGGMTIGSIQAFVSYVTFMMWPVQDLARIFAEIQHAIASAERIFSLLDAVPTVADRPDAFDPGSIQGDIEFIHTTFWYDDDEEKKPVIEDFNLHVRRGETIALVGPTGGGKSTIVNLACRFYEPKDGWIKIGGHDYREYSLNAIQSRIGVVLQTPHLFSGTVRENIRYGRLDATNEEIEVAAKLAGAHDFIMRLDKTYDQEVGEGGNQLSVGQKQLISLTRAIMAKPEVFIMDEATSSVDTLTEALIQKGMENLMKSCTSFVIAHRLSTIKRANRIMVIEEGKIAEAGTHAELLRLRGKYYQLYTKQFRHQMEEVLDPFSQVEQVESPAPASSAS